MKGFQLVVYIQSKGLFNDVNFIKTIYSSFYENYKSFYLLLGMHFIDQLNREILITQPPQRIISLVPSQTELLHYLGLDEEVIGITKFCIHPSSWFSSKKRIGGTKNFKIEEILALSPDLIIANKEENTKEGLEKLAENCPVWISDIQNVTDAIGMIKDLGLILNRTDEAEELILKIDEKKEALKTNQLRQSCIYLIWQNPYMTVGGDTYISNMLNIAGFENIYKDIKRYPELTLEELKKSKAENIFLSSEPYPFKQKHKEYLEKETGKRVFLVDGEAFSWYGNRILFSFEYFRKLQNQIEQSI